jgi:hypothetical protein
VARKDTTRNIAHYIPVAQVEHEVDEEGLVKLLTPRFQASWMQWLQKRLKRPYLKVKLDDVGSKTWLLIDGKRTVHEIGQKLLEVFDERIEPVPQRLGLFFGHLRRYKFVDLQERASGVPPSQDKSPIEPR